jgi:hypothetical protein
VSPPPGSDHWAYQAASWWFANGHAFLPTAAALCFISALLIAAYLWFLQGARIIAAAWVWRRAWRRWRAPRPGGAGDRAHTARYRAVMASGGWRRRRAAAIRRAGRRCQRCGVRGPLDVHHLTYRRLGRERPGDLLALCESCHGALHGRPAGADAGA